MLIVIKNDAISTIIMISWDSKKKGHIFGMPSHNCKAPIVLLHRLEDA